ncbi:Farnesyl diphosphate synthase [compost metagenome]
MPAILAKVTDEELNKIKRFAYHAGIAFQIKDDLLDAQSNEQKLGKPIGQDMQNNSSTFVSILGEAQAEREMWEHYCDATEALQQFTKGADYLKHILGYIIHRDR